MSKYKPGDKFEIEVIREDEELKSFYVTSVGLLHEKTLNSLRKIEPEVDWSKVEIDTPILVSNYSEAAWVRRYFPAADGRSRGRCGRCCAALRVWRRQAGNFLPR